jgi:hypothetical protein
MSTCQEMKQIHTREINTVEKPVDGMRFAVVLTSLDF